MLELHNESREWVERPAESDVLEVWKAGFEVEHGRGIAGLRDCIEVRKRWRRRARLEERRLDESFYSIWDGPFAAQDFTLDFVLWPIFSLALFRAVASCLASLASLQERFVDAGYEMAREAVCCSNDIRHVQWSGS